MTRDELVKRIAAAMADGKDSGGYDTLLDMYAHITIKKIECRKRLSTPPAALIASIYCDRSPGDVLPKLSKRKGKR
ncbi:MAG TPA: hypothetical protein VFQ43_21425 [Nitrososphaera sp.]|nr:hypothetical protein [Nitrososphaera sp.]